ncbi:hypothetical protein P4E94_01800 [Pontiellaceae bacterium B12219]|nr:hypothetical protein [Pontiellaceae bacterium B12219]
MTAVDEQQAAAQPMIQSSQPAWKQVSLSVVPFGLWIIYLL